MKNIKPFRRIVPAVGLSLILLCGINSSRAQSGKPRGAAIKHAEAVLGKPLSPAQKKAVRAAQKERQQAIKPIQQNFKRKVAGALGLTVAQYEARDKALRHKKGR